MTAGSMVTMASLIPPIKKRKGSPWSLAYFDRTCTGLRTIATESAKERDRETTGTGEGNVIPRDPDGCPEACVEPPGVSCGLREAFGTPLIRDHAMKISLRFPIASTVSGDERLPASWWGAAGREHQTLRLSPSRSG